MPALLLAALGLPHEPETDSGADAASATAASTGLCGLEVKDSGTNGEPASLCIGCCCCCGDACWGDAARVAWITFIFSASMRMALARRAVVSLDTVR